MMVGLTAVILHFYPEAQKKQATTHEGIGYQIIDNVAAILADLAQSKPTTNTIVDDPNFYYLVKDNKQNVLVVSDDQILLEKEDPADFMFYADFSFDATGHIIDDQKQWTSILINQIEERINQTGHFPLKNCTLTLAVPNELVSQDGSIASYVASDWDVLTAFAIFWEVVGCVAVVCLIFLTPLRLLDGCIPFASFRKLKGEWNPFVVGMGLLLIPALVIWLVILTLSSGEAALERTLGGLGIFIPAAGYWTVNWLAWLLLFVLASIVTYDVKYVILDGVWRFLKEDTYLGCAFTHLINIFKSLAALDLEDRGNKQLLKWVILQLGIIFALNLLSFFGIGFILSVIYSYFLFHYLRRLYQKHQNDYQALLQATRELSYGQFDDVKKADFGIFDQMKDALYQISVNYERAIQEETKSTRMKTELISNVSHDLKTPLTGMYNYLELLDDPTMSQEEKEKYIQVLKQYVSRFKSLVDDLFEVSKVNSGDITLNLEKLDILALVMQVKAEHADGLTEKSLQILVQCDKPHMYVLLDGEKTYRIFENLFTNIAKYALAKTRVYIDIVQENDQVVLTFKNISETILDFDPQEIMERFARGDKSRHLEGSGLGLAIVKSFVEAQKGSFTIQTDGDLFKAVVTFGPLLDDQKDE